MSEIKPCPFCGEVPRNELPGVVHCQNIDCAIYDTWINDEEWNRRAVDNELLEKIATGVGGGAAMYESSEAVDAINHAAKIVRSFKEET